MSDANHVISCCKFQVIYKLGFINCESNTIFVKINSLAKWYEILRTSVLRANVTIGQTFRGKSSKFNLAHILRLGRP